MYSFKIPSYALNRCRFHFLSPGICLGFGDANLHQRKLIASALHLTTIAAQRIQPNVHRPVFAHAIASDMLSFQQAAAPF